MKDLIVSLKQWAQVPAIHHTTGSSRKLGTLFELLRVPAHCSRSFQLGHRSLLARSLGKGVWLLKDLKQVVTPGIITDDDSIAKWVKWVHHRWALHFNRHIPGYTTQPHVQHSSIGVSNHADCHDDHYTLGYEILRSLFCCASLSFKCTTDVTLIVAHCYEMFTHSSSITFYISSGVASHANCLS